MTRLLPVLLVGTAACSDGEPIDTAPDFGQTEYSSVCFHDDKDGCRTSDGDRVGDERIECGSPSDPDWYDCVVGGLDWLGREGWHVQLGDDGFPQVNTVYLMWRDAP